MEVNKYERSMVSQTVFGKALHKMRLSLICRPLALKLISNLWHFMPGLQRWSSEASS